MCSCEARRGVHHFVGVVFFCDARRLRRRIQYKSIEGRTILLAILILRRARANPLQINTNTKGEGRTIWLAIFSFATHAGYAEASTTNQYQYQRGGAHHLVGDVFFCDARRLRISIHYKSIPIPKGRGAPFCWRCFLLRRARAGRAANGSK